MGYIDVINHFWEEFRKDPLPSSAVALFFYLTNECNRERWHMPVRCYSVVIRQSLSISEATLTRSRDELSERGFIKFSQGRRNVEAPKYVIVGIDNSCELSNETTDETTHDTKRATTGETTNKKKKEDKDIDKSKKSFFSLTVLESRMLDDTKWLSTTTNALKEQGFSIIKDNEIKEMIKQFFVYLGKKGYEEREEEDCRNHFINWIKIKLKKNKDFEYGKQNDKRRGTEVSATSPEEYEGAF